MVVESRESIQGNQNVPLFHEALLIDAWTERMDSRAVNLLVGLYLESWERKMTCAWCVENKGKKTAPKLNIEM